METLRADCLVVGAGPAGATVARLLALKGRAVVVADPSAGVRRLELLAPASLPTIAALGLGHLLDDPSVARPCLGIRRTRGLAEYSYEDFLRHPCRLGHVVDRTHFDARLREAAVAAGATFCRFRATGVAPDGGVICRAHRSGTMALVEADVVIDATGRAAAIARRRGARVTARDRMVAELLRATPEDTTADAESWLDYRSDELGWSYRIHGPGGRAETWRVHASRTPGGQALRTVDASARVLSKAAGEGWIAVGDAAIAFDPISSQGLFNALSSAMVAAGALISPNRLSPATAGLYSDAILATFRYSQAGRAAVYNSNEALNRLSPLCSLS